MTEKEFLTTFIQFYWKDEPSYVGEDAHPEQETINNFLEQHHKEYYEVEFEKIEDDKEDLLAEMNSEYNDMIARSINRRK